MDIIENRDQLKASLIELNRKYEAQQDQLITELDQIDWSAFSPEQRAELLDGLRAELLDGATCLPTRFEQWFEQHDAPAVA